MCGICGFNFEDKSLLKKMSDLIIHRGPDNEGFYIDNYFSIGIRRLSIIDLKTGHQPQHNENEDIWVVHNGEIYNFLELRNKLEDKGHDFYTNSDTEVILHAYEEWGDACVNKFRGAFSFCIYDTIKHIILLARDHIGLKPLYYYFDGDRFVFGSEIKCILCFGIHKEINLNAFNFYLSLNYVPNDETLFKGVYKLPPSSYLKFNLKDKKISINKYWIKNFNVNNFKTEKILAKELRNLLEESIKIRLVSDVPLGAFLSGGIDSSTVVALMSKFMEKPVKTFSIGFEEGAPVNETKYAKVIANYYNTDHKELIVKSNCFEIIPKLVWHLDDLFSDAAIIPVYYMSLLAREKIKVALTGDGSDELFSGYSVYYKKKPPYVKYLPNFGPSLIDKYYKYIPSQKIRTILSFIKKTDEERYFRTLFTILDKEKTFAIPFQGRSVEKYIKNTYYKELDFINKQVNWDINYQLPNLYNMKTDKMSMAASLEARVPFLDRKIVSWSSNIPSELKLKNSTEKYILRLAVKDILPSEILKRKKLGFGTPINLWLQKGLKQISNEILINLEKRKKLFNSKFVENIRKYRLKAHFQNQVWNLLMFEIWYETFIESDGLKPIKF